MNQKKNNNTIPNFREDTIVDLQCCTKGFHVIALITTVISCECLQTSQHLQTTANGRDLLLDKVITTYLFVTSDLQHQQVGKNSLVTGGCHGGLAGYRHTFRNKMLK